jgi:hypothetical protein
LAVQQQLHGKQSIQQAPTLRLMGRLALEREYSRPNNMRAAPRSCDQHDHATVWTGHCHGDLGRHWPINIRKRRRSRCTAALAIETATLGADHPRIAELNNRLADALEGQGKYDAAAL